MLKFVMQTTFFFAVNENTLVTNLKSNSSMFRQNAKRRVASGEELEGSLGKVYRRSVGLHSHHPLVVWTRSELVAFVEKRANQKRRITAGRERAVTETAVCPVPLAVPDKDARRRRETRTIRPAGRRGASPGHPVSAAASTRV